MTTRQPDARFQIDGNRRWMVAEFIPDAGDGHPSTTLREPTDSEWAAAREPEAIRLLREWDAAWIEGRVEAPGDPVMWDEETGVAARTHRFLAASPEPAEGLDVKADWTFAMLAVSIAIHQDNPPGDRFSCESCRDIVAKARAIFDESDAHLQQQSEERP